MEDIKSRELRDRKSNANTRICFEVRATALRPRLHTEGFQLSTIGSFTKGSPSRNYNNTTLEYTTPTLTPLHKGKAQSKEKNTTW